jgi:hypothetical protein
LLNTALRNLLRKSLPPLMAFLPSLGTKYKCSGTLNELLGFGFMMYPALYSQSTSLSLPGSWQHHFSPLWFIKGNFFSREDKVDTPSGNSVTKTQKWAEKREDCTKKIRSLRAKVTSHTAESALLTS